MQYAHHAESYVFLRRTFPFLLRISETQKAPASEETGATEQEVRHALFDGHEVSDATYQKVLAFARFALEEERRQKGE